MSNANALQEISSFFVAFIAQMHLVFAFFLLTKYKGSKLNKSSFVFLRKGVHHSSSELYKQRDEFGSLWSYDPYFGIVTNDPYFKRTAFKPGFQKLCGSTPFSTSFWLAAYRVLGVQPMLRDLGASPTCLKVTSLVKNHEAFLKQNFKFLFVLFCVCVWFVFFLFSQFVVLHSHLFLGSIWVMFQSFRHSVKSIHRHRWEG